MLRYNDLFVLLQRAMLQLKQQLLVVSGHHHQLLVRLRQVVMTLSMLFLLLLLLLNKLPYLPLLQGNVLIFVYLLV